MLDESEDVNSSSHVEVLFANAHSQIVRWIDNLLGESSDCSWIDSKESAIQFYLEWIKTTGNSYLFGELANLPVSLLVHIFNR